MRRGRTEELTKGQISAYNPKPMHFFCCKNEQASDYKQIIIWEHTVSSAWCWCASNTLLPAVVPRPLPGLQT